MNAFLKPLAGMAAGLLLACSAVLPLDAEAAGRGAGHWRGGHHHGGHGWAGLVLGIGLGTLILSRPWEPVVVERPVPVYHEPPAPLVQYRADAMPVPPRAADPVIYPNHGQSAEQLEGDRQACNRWATTQRDAMADASIFHRATLACLEGRGYTVR